MICHFNNTHIQMQTSLCTVGSISKMSVCRRADKVIVESLICHISSNTSVELLFAANPKVTMPLSACVQLKWSQWPFLSSISTT